ncbi:MAG: flagellin [Thiohalomonadaceae bacterium]
MPQIINTNVMSLNSQRNLNTSQAALQTSLQRLSSGLRINSAKDDAAGLAISERFTTQIRGLSQASRNANDGISLAQTAEGALAEVNNNLQRIRELAVQSANATNSASDRAALDLEVQQRIAEIDRVASQTSFNGQKILDGTFGTAAFQVGANVGETINLNLSTSMRTTAIGKTADYVGGSAYNTNLAVGQQGTGVTSTNLTGNNLTVAIGGGNAVDIGSGLAGTAPGQGLSSAYAKAAAINAAGIGGLTATADTTMAINFTTTATNGYELSINGIAVQSATTAALDGTQLASNINANASATGVTATFAAGVMTLTAVDGRDITIAQTATAAEGFQTPTANNNTVNATADFSGGTVSFTARGSIRMSAADTINVQGTDAAKIGYTAGSLALGNSALNSTNVTTVSNANDTIQRVDAALTSVSSLRSTFGAVQNRFESTIASLATTSENLSASRSRIQDTDFAEETAALTRSQILQQAGIAMLSQANMAPQNVLSLLQ